MSDSKRLSSLAVLPDADQRTKRESVVRHVLAEIGVF